MAWTKCLTLDISTWELNPNLHISIRGKTVGKGPQKVSHPTSCSHEGQFWDQTGLLRTWSSWVLRAGDCPVSVGNMFHVNLHFIRVFPMVSSSSWDLSQCHLLCESHRFLGSLLLGRHCSVWFALSTIDQKVFRGEQWFFKSTTSEWIWTCQPYNVLWHGLLWESLHFFMLMSEELGLAQQKCSRKESFSVLLKRYFSVW